MDRIAKRSLGILRKDINRILSQSFDSFSLKPPTDIYNWDILILGSPGSLYEGGVYKAVMKFPISYPDNPPIFIFLSEMFHPNIEDNGKICISILHTGDDITGYEQTMDRWMPVRTPESVIMSVILLLDNPNWDSPANVEVVKCYFNNELEYKRIVRRLAQTSSEDTKNKYE